jgi:hypothetical protein
MSQRNPETTIPVVVDRNFPIEVFAESVRAIADSGVVDGIQMWDQMTGWNPRCLWTPDRTPLARAVPDLDSFADWFPMMAYAAAIAPKLNSVIKPHHLLRLGRPRSRTRRRGDRGAGIAKQRLLGLSARRRLVAADRTDAPPK